MNFFFFFFTDKINSHVNPISGNGEIISLSENQKLGKNREIDQREREREMMSVSRGNKIPLPKKIHGRNDLVCGLGSSD